MDKAAVIRSVVGFAAVGIGRPSSAWTVVGRQLHLRDLGDAFESDRPSPANRRDRLTMRFLHSSDCGNQFTRPWSDQANPGSLVSSTRVQALMAPGMSDIDAQGDFL